MTSSRSSSCWFNCVTNYTVPVVHLLTILLSLQRQHHHPVRLTVSSSDCRSVLYSDCWMVTGSDREVEIRISPKDVHATTLLPGLCSRGQLGSLDLPRTVFIGFSVFFDLCRSSQITARQYIRCQSAARGVHPATCTPASK